MYIEEILNLDYRESKSERIIQRALSRINPIEKYMQEEEVDEVPIDVVEKLIHKVCYRYDVTIWDIRVDSRSSKDYSIYKCDIIETDTLLPLKTLFAMCLYELYAKIIIFLWTEKQAGRLKKRRLRL